MAVVARATNTKKTNHSDRAEIHNFNFNQVRKILRYTARRAVTAG